MSDTSSRWMLRLAQRLLSPLLTVFGTSKNWSSNASSSRHSSTPKGFRGRPVDSWSTSTSECSNAPKSNSKLPLRITHYDNRFLALQIHDPNTNATWIINCQSAAEVFQTVQNASHGTTEKAPDFFVRPSR